MKQDDIRFHSERAMTELDRALCAATSSAARAHFDLSALHLQRMQSLSEVHSRPHARS